MLPPVLLIGGSGFVGRAVCARLLERGYPVTVPTRQPPPTEHRDALPKARWVVGSVLDAHFLASLCAETGPSGIVINLAGILHSRPATPYGPEFKALHVDFVHGLITTLSAHGIRRLLHVSALGADRQGPSMYLRSKGEGECLVRLSSLDWTIFRPSVIFGRHDHFINLFSGLARRFPILPLACASAQFQPVSVENLAEAMVRSLSLPQTLRQSYDIAGPRVFTLAELVEFASRRAGFSRPILPLPFWLAWIQARIFEAMPGPVLMSRDNLASMQSPNVLPSGAPQVLDTVFGIVPEPLESLE